MTIVKGRGQAMRERLWGSGVALVGSDQGHNLWVEGEGTNMAINPEGGETAFGDLLPAGSEIHWVEAGRRMQVRPGAHGDPLLLQYELDPSVRDASEEIR